MPEALTSKDSAIRPGASSAWPATSAMAWLRSPLMGSAVSG
jgi:hypothetical protein